MTYEAYGSVTKVLVGLQRVGIVRLREAIEEARKAGLQERGETTEFLLRVLEPYNYFPEAARDLFRLACWREFVRAVGGDLRPLFSEVEVILRAAPTLEREPLEATLRAILAKHELAPRFRIEPIEEGASPLVVLIGGREVHRGGASRAELEEAVRKRISNW